MGSCAAASANINISDILEVDPEDWSQIYVIEWLKSTCEGELSVLIEPFKKHQICGYTFVKLTNEQLKDELEIKQFGLREQFIYHRDKLLLNYQQSITQTQMNLPNVEPFDTKQTIIVTQQQCLDNTEKNLKKCTNIQAQNKKDCISLQFSNVMEKRHTIHKQVVHLLKSVEYKDEITDSKQDLVDLSLTPGGRTNSFTNLEVFAEGKQTQTLLYPSGRVTVTPNYSPQPSRLNMAPSDSGNQLPLTKASNYHHERYNATNYKFYLNGISHCSEEFNLRKWDFTTFLSFPLQKEIKDVKYEIPEDYHTLQQYKDHCYLHFNKIVINGYANQIEKDILNDANNRVIIPNEVRQICCKYYFEYEWHVLQFAYDVSWLLTYIQIDHVYDYGGSPMTNRFTGSSLVDIIFQNRFKQKYRLKQQTVTAVIADYCDELIKYGFIKVVAEKSAYYLSNIVDVRDKLFGYDKNKKNQFDKYQQFMIDQFDRNAWTIGTIVQIFSSSLGGWQRGKIIEIDPLNTNDIVIQYNMGTMNKKIDRYDEKVVKSTRKFILNRNNWKAGTKVEVFFKNQFVKNPTAQMWFPAKIKNILTKPQYRSRPQLINENEIQIEIVYMTVFDDEHKYYIVKKWSPMIRDVIPTKEAEIDNVMAFEPNPKHRLWNGFIRRHSNKIIPMDIIKLIRSFCEIVVVWNIEKDKMEKILTDCSYKDVIIGPQFELEESRGVKFQLTLCPQDGPNIINYDNMTYVVCYLELKNMPNHIKTMSFLIQFYCSELQHDCRGTVFYDSSDINHSLYDYTLSESWSWGKQIIPFEYLNKNKLTSLHIECVLDIIHIEYKEKCNIKNKIGWLLPPFHMKANVEYKWRIDNKLLNIFKYSKVKKRYFNEALWNNCWMMSVEPNGKDDNVYLILTMIRLPFKEKSKMVSYKWEIETNNHIIFTHTAKTHKFVLNMDEWSDYEWSDYSEQKTRMCSKTLFKKLPTLKITVYIELSTQ